MGLKPERYPMKRLIALLPLLAFLSACSGGMSSAPAPDPTPPPLDPTGVYDCWLSVEGMEFGAVLTIEGVPGTYTGTVDSEMGTMPVRDLTVDGDQMSFVVDTPDMTVPFNVRFEGGTFSGDFDAGGMLGYVTGEKR